MVISFCCRLRIFQKIILMATGERGIECYGNCVVTSAVTKSKRIRLIVCQPVFVAASDGEETFIMRRNKMKPGAPAKVELNKALERIKKSNNRQVDVICPACGYKLRTSVKWAQRGFPTCSCGTTMEFLPRYEDRVSQVDLVVAPAALPINGQADATVREVKTIAGQIARLQDKLSAFLEAGLDRTSVQVANVQSQIDNLTDKLGALADA